MKKAYIGLGSNLGDRLTNLIQSLEMLLAEPQIFLEKVSSVYETEPVGGPDQGPFLNACALLLTNLNPEQLLQDMLSVENKMKRVRNERWGPRLIDLDLLFYEGVTMHTPFLELPHPRLAERDFVLIPLADIAPDLLIPNQDKNVMEIIKQRGHTNSVIIYQQQNWFKF